MTFANIPNTRKSKEYTELSYQRFIDRPPLETKSRVAIVRGNNYLHYTPLSWSMNIYLSRF
jgi:hypothetical protein